MQKRQDLKLKNKENIIMACKGGSKKSGKSGKTGKSGKGGK